MIKKLFGETKEEQLKYLGWRTLVSVVAIIISGIVAICGAGDFAGGILLTSMFVLWGIPAIKMAVRFFASTASCSRNIIVQVLLFAVAICVAYVLGVGIALLGIIRCAQLFITELIDNKNAKNKNVQG